MLDPPADEERIVAERTQVASGSPYEEMVGFSRAVRVGAHAYVAGTAPVWPDGEVDPDPAAQARRCWEIALDALARVGGEPRHVVRTRQFLTPAADPDAVAAVHGRSSARCARRARCWWWPRCSTPLGGGGRAGRRHRRRLTAPDRSARPRQVSPAPGDTLPCGDVGPTDQEPG